LLQAILPDNLKGSFNIFNYIVIPESYYDKSVRTQTGTSLLIVLQIICMLPAVQFYGNSLLKRYEIYDICLDWLLPAKFDTFELAVSQISP